MKEAYYSNIQGYGRLKLVFLFLLLLPFIQMGYSYYISIQFILFLLVIRYISLNVLIYNLHILLISLGLMILPVLLLGTGDILHSLLRVFREWLCFSCFILLLDRRRKPAVISPALETNFLILIMSLCFMVMMQALLLHHGIVVMASPDWLVENKGTMSSIYVAAKHGLYGTIRPSALYGEPSYLAFITVSILYIVLCSFRSAKTRRLVIALAIIIAIVSRSLSAALAIVVLLLVDALASKRFSSTKRILFVSGGLFLGGLGFVLFANSWLVERVMGFGISMDSSSVVRLVIPFILISKVFVSHWFGVPADSESAVFGPLFGGQVLGTDNGLLNLFINYGYSGFVLLIMLLYKARHSVRLMTYLLLVSMFNGAFLSIDKVAVAGFAILLTYALKNVYRRYLINSLIVMYRETKP